MEKDIICERNDKIIIDRQEIMTRYPEGVFAPFYISEFKTIMNKFF